jgi:cytochrome c peroxidase
MKARRLDDPRPRRVQFAFVIGVAAALLEPELARGGVATSAGAGVAMHGATRMDRQLEKVETLVQHEVGTAAPAGLSSVYWPLLAPDDNQLTDARIALGKKLYFDPRLSADGTVACATCHDVSRGFTDRRMTSEGIRDQVGRRNAPTTMNAVFFQSQFLDGRAASLEEQAKLPILNAIEMGQPDARAATTALAADKEYVDGFQNAYGRAPNYDDIGRALASYERTLVFLTAPFDKFAAGDIDAIDADAIAGWALFSGKARCVSCHQISSLSPIGTDNRFHNIGVAARHSDFEQLALRGLKALGQRPSKEAIDQLALETDLGELGRFVVTRNRADIGAFKTQQVRNVGVTAPYMHDGSMATLWDVVDHYNKGGEANPYLDGGIEPLGLTPREEDQLVAFLFSLTDERLEDQNSAEEARQRKLAAVRRPFRDDALANRQVLPFERRAQEHK